MGWGSTAPSRSACSLRGEEIKSGQRLSSEDIRIRPVPGDALYAATWFAQDRPAAPLSWTRLPWRPAPV